MKKNPRQHAPEVVAAIILFAVCSMISYRIGVIHGTNNTIVVNQRPVMTVQLPIIRTSFTGTPCTKVRRSEPNIVHPIVVVPEVKLVRVELPEPIAPPLMASFFASEPPAILNEIVSIRPVIPALANAIGYRTTVPREVARNFPIRKKLQACAVLTDGTKDCSYTAWANKTNGQLVLNVSMKELPQQDFSLYVARNIKGDVVTIPGDWFVEEAHPFTGRFPHPSGASHVLWGLGGMALRGGLGTITGGPIMGASAAFAQPTLKFALTWRAKRAAHKAERDRILTATAFQTPTHNQQ